MSGPQTFATGRADGNAPATNGAMDEAAAFTTAMNALFHPKRIAVVGATPRPGFANTIHGRILAGGYEGEVFGVTPRHDEVLGCKCYPTIDAIPGGVDKAIVVVPSGLVMDVLDQAERAGTKALNIITSGFGEQNDEAARERQNAHSRIRPSYRHSHRRAELSRNHQHAGQDDRQVRRLHPR